jgi:DNA-binding transcriptional regulator GbsR (MarR family)
MMQLTTPRSTSVLPSPRSADGAAERDPVAMEAALANGLGQLGAVELEIIEVFVSIVRMLGIPKSVAEIYGLLFVTPEPLALDAIVERLQISKGSVSQGLKLLRSLGGVKTSYVAGDRRDHYVAETELKKLVAGFLRGEVEPRLASGRERLAHLRDMAEALPDAKQNFLSKRVGKLQQWHTKSRDLLPLLGVVLDEEVGI